MYPFSSLPSQLFVDKVCLYFVQTGVTWQRTTIAHVSSKKNLAKKNENTPYNANARTQ